MNCKVCRQPPGYHKMDCPRRREPGTPSLAERASEVLDARLKQLSSWARSSTPLYIAYEETGTLTGANATGPMQVLWGAGETPEAALRDAADHVHVTVKLETRAVKDDERVQIVRMLGMGAHL